MKHSAEKKPPHFKIMLQTDVPQGRKGKHNGIVHEILSDLDDLKPGSAMKIPIAGLDETMQKVRSALNRATRKAGRKVATASDEEFLYVWNISTE
jgi:hypothetical protein